MIEKYGLSGIEHVGHARVAVAQPRFIRILATINLARHVDESGGFRTGVPHPVDHQWRNTQHARLCRTQDKHIQAVRSRTMWPRIIKRDIEDARRKSETIKLAAMINPRAD